MLKPTYIFIQQHNFIDFENNIFLSIIHINHPLERFDFVKSNPLEVSNKGQPQYEKNRFVFHL